MKGMLILPVIKLDVSFGSFLTYLITDLLLEDLCLAHRSFLCKEICTFSGEDLVDLTVVWF